MTDFIERLQEYLYEGERRGGMRSSEVVGMSMRFVEEELYAQEKRFGKRLLRVGEKARVKMEGFGNRLRESRQRIVLVMEVVQQMSILLERGKRSDDLGECLKKRLAYHAHKKDILQKMYPSTEIKDDQAFTEDSSFVVQSIPTYIIKCHHSHSLESCTPQNDQILDQQITSSLQDLFSSLQRSLTHFQNNYSHLAGEDINQVVAILKREYRRARQKVTEQCPTVQQIQNVKEMELIVRGTLQQRIYEIRQQQKKIYSQIHSQPLK